MTIYETCNLPQTKSCAFCCNYFNVNEEYVVIDGEPYHDHSWCRPHVVKPPEVEPENDLVNHPRHYTSNPSGVECIQVTQHMNFCIGNAVKYLWRAGIKDEETTVQDLEKAIWYINQEIKRLSATNMENNH